VHERLVVVWRVTTRCNLACPFCAYDRRLDISRVNADASLIARMAPTFAQWSKATGLPVLVSWLGGEPLLWAPLAELTQHYRAHGLQVSTTTNGTPLANPALRRHIADNYAELTISVDAFGGQHDALRGRAGLFDELRCSVRALVAEARGSDLLLRANVVLMRDTITGFPALCRELASWGIREITCNELGGRDRPEFFPANRLLPAHVEHLQRTWSSLQQELAASSVRLCGEPAYLERMAASARGEHMNIADCGPGERYLFIDETGRVAPCSFTVEEYGIPLKEADIPSLPARFTTARSCLLSPQCRDCHSTQVFRKFALT
jgi:MoaA/NifB/PqqE/SkfB family radical SAM enzyme